MATARERQMQRGQRLNARLQGRALRSAAALDSDARKLLAKALARFSLSARGYDRVLRVARTIADIDGADRVGYGHLAEALQYRGDV